MSNALGQVRFKDGTVRHFEFIGSSDTCYERTYDSPYEVELNWRKHAAASCCCGNDEPVEIFAAHADGLFWPGRACKACHCITAGRYPHLQEEADPTLAVADGVPDWA